MARFKLLFALSLVIIAGCGGSLATPTIVLPQTWSSRIGIQTYDDANHDREPSSHSQAVGEWLATLNTLASVNTPQVRTTIAYDEATTGTFDGGVNQYIYIDALVNKVLKPRLEALKGAGYSDLILTFQTYRDASNPWPMDTESRRRFSGWVSGILSGIRDTYPEEKLIVQIGNEPSQTVVGGALATIDDVQSYVSTLETVVDALKERGLRARVIAAAYNTTDFPGSKPRFTATQWMNLLQARGVLAKLYGVSLHAYKGRFSVDGSAYVPEANSEEIDLVRTYLGTNQEVVLTEAGSHRLYPSSAEGEAAQEQTAIRFLLLALVKDLKHVILYEAKDRSGRCSGVTGPCSEAATGADPSEKFFGLMDQSRKLNLAGSSVKSILSSYGNFWKDGTVINVTPYRHRLFITNGIRKVRIQWASKAADSTSDFPLRPAFVDVSS